MKTPICAFVIVLLIGTLLPFDASSQNQPLVVVSPRVGGVIDWQEVTTYRLFPTIKNFHSASFYQAPDSTLSAVVQLKSTEGIFSDSVFAISFGLLNAYAERIDHWEELLQGTYQMGTSLTHILYDDGTPLKLPSTVSMETLSSPRHGSTDAIPLALNISELLRPRFETIRLDVAIGFVLSNFSEIEQLTGGPNNVYIPATLYVQVPIMEDPSIMLIGGWGFAVGGGGGGSIYSFSSFLLYRPGSFSFLKPIVGFGAGYTNYNYSSPGIIINASESYPALLLGLNIVPHTFAILLTYPLTRGLNTTFESKSYTIKPAGFGLSLLLSL